MQSHSTRCAKSAKNHALHPSRRKCWKLRFTASHFSLATTNQLSRRFDISIGHKIYDNVIYLLFIYIIFYSINNDCNFKLFCLISHFCSFRYSILRCNNMAFLGHIDANTPRLWCSFYYSLLLSMNCTYVDLCFFKWLKYKGSLNSFQMTKLVQNHMKLVETKYCIFGAWKIFHGLSIFLIHV